MIAGSTREQLSAKYVRLPIDRSDTSQVTGLHRSDRAQSGGTPIVLLGEVAPMHTSTHACSARTAYWLSQICYWAARHRSTARCPTGLIGAIGATPITLPKASRFGWASPTSVQPSLTRCIMRVPCLFCLAVACGPWDERGHACCSLLLGGWPRAHAPANPISRLMPDSGLGLW